jgi:hypothetical protein
LALATGTVVVAGLHRARKDNRNFHFAGQARKHFHLYQPILGVALSGPHGNAVLTRPLDVFEAVASSPQETTAGNPAGRPTHAHLISLAVIMSGLFQETYKNKRQQRELHILSAVSNHKPIQYHYMPPECSGSLPFLQIHWSKGRKNKSTRPATEGRP